MQPLRLIAISMIFSSLCLGYYPAVFAGLYDRDTSAMRHAKVNPEVLLINVITGHIPYESEGFYRKRIDLLKTRIQQSPNTFDLYDDMSVAHHRLKDFDTAIQWMNKKSARLQLYMRNRRMDERVARRLWFRTYANLSSHHLSKYLYAKKEQAKVSDLQSARDYLLRAINRSKKDKHPLEDVELALIDWLIQHTKAENAIKSSEADTFRFHPLLKKEHKAKHASLRPLRTALTHMILQSNADDPLLLDLHWNLYLTLQRRQDHAMAYLLRQRMQQLLVKSHQSYVIQLMPEKEVDAANFHLALFSTADPVNVPRRAQQLLSDYQEAQEHSDQLIRTRNLYLKRELFREKHPDKNADFYPRQYLQLEPLYLLLNPTFQNWQPLTNNPLDVCDC